MGTGLTRSLEKRAKADAIELTSIQFDCEKTYIYPIINGIKYQHRKDIIAAYKLNLAEQIEKRKEELLKFQTA